MLSLYTGLPEAKRLDVLLDQFNTKLSCLNLDQAERELLKGVKVKKGHDTSSGVATTVNNSAFRWAAV